MYVVLWFLLSAAALSPWGYPTVWVSALTLPVVGIGFAWGWRKAMRLGLASAAVSLSLLLKGQPAWSVVGPWSGFILAPLLIRRKEHQERQETEALLSGAAELKRKTTVLHSRRQDLSSRISGLERSIHEIGELYQLSKRFLATLELNDGLRIVEEVMEERMPVSKQKELMDTLDRVQALVEGGDVAVERLIQAMPLTDADLKTRERWGIAIGQLALGLQRIALYRRVQESATQDGLTGQLVRRVFRERLEGEVERALRRGTSLAFLMVDLDHFKQINDTYGHLVGDVVLREVARLIRVSVREMDLVGRYGGEEFAVALPDAGSALGFQIAERIRKTIESASIRAYDEEVQLTVSIGIGMCPIHASTAEQLVEHADQAMYQAKALGRNRTVTSQ